MKDFHTKLVTIILGLLIFFIVVGLLIVQLNWSKSVTEQEFWRLKGEISQKTLAAAKELEDELALLSIITKTKKTDYNQIKDKLESSIPFWRYNCINAGIFSDIFYLDINKEESTLFWNGDFLVPAESSVAHALFLRIRNLFYSYYQRNGVYYFAFSDGTEMILSTISEVRKDYLLVCVLNKKEFSSSVIPTVISHYFINDSNYYVRVRDVSTNDILYSNTSPENDSYFSNPDFTWSLFNSQKRNAEEAFKELNPSWSFPEFIYYEDIQYPFEELKDTLQSLPKNGEVQKYPPIPNEIDGISQLIIEVVHREGSVVRAAIESTKVNIGISIIFSFLLIIAIIILVNNLRKSQKLAQKQQEFIATVTHELKTPISVISLSAQNMADGIITSPEKVANYGKMMRKESDRLKNTIDYFLLYSNLQNGMKRQHECCEVQKIIEYILDMNNTKISKSGFLIERMYYPKPLFIYCDKYAITSVFQNMFDNAIKHAREGHFLRITVDTDLENKKVIIHFLDKGEGIPKKERKEIFAPFMRGSNAMKKQIDGSGIGLNLSMRIIEQHKGTISANNNTWGGADFEITIPLYVES
jgi:two-component system phosphate regulon sensor histidine kinase PhoR